MRYLTFGRRTGLRVSEYALGTAVFGTRWGYGAKPDQARKIFERFAEAGGTFVDTANAYQFGEAEEILGSLLGSERDSFVLGTKYSIGTNPQVGIYGTGNSRKTMTRTVEASLRRLRTDHVDLLWVHFPDQVTPTEEIMRGLDDLVRAGKILHGGLSNFPAWRAARAATLADLNGWSPLVGVQFEYSLVERTADREILPMADALGLGAALWSPLGGGVLTGKYRGSREGRLSAGRRVRTEETSLRVATVEAVLAMADEVDATPAQVATNWLRARGAHSSTAYVPIIGPRTLAQLEEYLAGLDVTLTPEQVDRLTRASAIPLGEPYEEYDKYRSALLGGDDVARGFVAPIVPVA
ncbi:aldo/keto reductase [Actinopolymorpha pittospori]|uniref:Aryl-alcohol dehydrogenase-like predicted oxidoreductase n=1 Tax=Actinopolymorpha pittospori TaxID=648752 RepID=A0A927RQH0_9ACTN|nr:aldo/keto reductase [Actinopolymorpha pittospori]MBE1613096.1 aryl-alcohol dehydrogenase-like predicted oxidoreductase [Actinopolymorpha pittospori]